ncbi:MAG: cyclic-di-AMP receptor [Oscillospiraceae bacterium]|jgi:uncharacterized protein YaaQ|nr:cyclic-di-AMP receptor [Oscillospiraceae bacterium]
MKLILAIVNNDDSSAVANHLTSGGFSVTRLATTGGFLKAGNTTFLVGTEDEKVPEVISLIEQYSKKRTQVVPAVTSYDSMMFTSVPVEVSIGGATIFVMNVDEFKKC